MDNSLRQVTFHMLFNQLHNPCFPVLGVYGSQPPLVGVYGSQPPPVGVYGSQPPLVGYVC